MTIPSIVTTKRKTMLILASMVALLLLCAFAARSSTNPWVETKLCVGCHDCMSKCPTGAISVMDGKAKIDDDKCINCKFCVQTCTYRAIRTPK